MRWMSTTESGSTPAKGSSRRMKRGSAASARAISTRRRSPPERLSPIWSRRWPTWSSFINDSARRSRSARSMSGRVSRMARMFCSTVSLRNTDGSWGR